MPIVEPTQEIVDLATQLYRVVRESNNGDPAETNVNIFQPGLVREFIIALHLGHSVNTNKRECDAVSNDRTELYEYLTAFGENNFQIDRVITDPQQRVNQLDRISRNHKIYFASFNEQDLSLITIWEIHNVDHMRDEADSQLNTAATNNVQIKHLTFSRRWLNVAVTNGHATIVFPRR